MTNSHCTDAFGSVTGSVIGQPDLSNRLVVEVFDPPLFTSATDAACPPSRNCRYTDAALFLVDASVDVSRFGFSAWTDSPNSIDFSGYNVFQSHSLYWFEPSIGDPLTKVGRSSGRTSGRITRTCVTAPQFDIDFFGNLFDTGRTLLCQYQGDYASLGGDSGAPVQGEGTYEPGKFWFDGIHWGSDGSVGTFSAWKYLRDEFRTVTPGGWYPAFVPQNGT